MAEQTPPAENLVVLCDPANAATRPEPKKRVFIHRQAREMAKNVLDLCVEERKNKCLIIPLNDALGRAHAYTGVGKRTLHAITKEAKAGPLRTPCKKGITINKTKNLNSDTIDRKILHEIIEEFYLIDNILPTCAKLQAAIRQKIDFPWGLTSVRKLLKEMGYKWLKSSNKRRILVEKPVFVFARSHYLREIREFRRAERNIFFLGETWIDQSLTYKKCWRNEAVDTILSDDSIKNRVLVVHAGSKEGFLKGAKFVFTKDEYQAHIDNVIFEKWVSKNVIPNLPPNSIIVMSNASYNTVQENKVPTKSCSKLAMIGWLNKMNMKATPDMRKDELFRLIECYKPADKIYRVDEFLKQYGHVVLRLPQFMCDLNPIELAWEKLNDTLKEHVNSENPYSLEELKTETDAALDAITNEDWRRYDSQVRCLEEQHWERDTLIENITDKYVAEMKEPEDESEAESDMSVIFETDDEAY